MASVTAPHSHLGDERPTRGQDQIDHVLVSALGADRISRIAIEPWTSPEVAVGSDHHPVEFYITR